MIIMNIAIWVLIMLFLGMQAANASTCTYGFDKHDYLVNDTIVFTFTCPELENRTYTAKWVDIEGETLKSTNGSVQNGTNLLEYQPDRPVGGILNLRIGNQSKDFPFKAQLKSSAVDYGKIALLGVAMFGLIILLNRQLEGERQ